MSVPHPPHPPSPSPHEPRNCQQVVAFFCFRFDISTYSTCARLGYDALTDIYIVELRTPAMPAGIGGGKERGGFHLNLRTWHAASCILLQSWHCGVRVAEAASRAMADSEREEWNSRSCSCSCCRCRRRCPFCRRCRRSRGRERERGMSSELADMTC